MELALAAQRVGGKGAEGGTVQHQPQMLRPGMFAAPFQAMGHRHGVTGDVAMLKRLDCVARLMAELVHDIALQGTTGNAAQVARFRRPDQSGSSHPSRPISLTKRTAPRPLSSNVSGPVRVRRIKRCSRADPTGITS